MWRRSANVVFLDRMQGIENHSKALSSLTKMNYLRSKRIRSIFALAASLMFAVNPILVFGSVCNCSSISNPEEPNDSACCISASLKTADQNPCCSEAEQCCCSTSVPPVTNSSCGCNFGCECSEPAPANQPLAPTPKSGNEVKTSTVLVCQFACQTGLVPESDRHSLSPTKRGIHFTTSAQVCALLSRFTC